MASPRYRTSILDGGRVLELRAADGRTVQYRRIGGYIYVVSLPGRPGTLGPQVCERLSGSGHTLSAKTDEGMVAVIRREARRAWDDEEGREPAYLWVPHG